MPRGLDIETMYAVKKIVTEILRIDRGEEVVITADTGSDWRVVEAIAQAVRLVEAKPIVLWFEAPPAVGKAADPYLPLRVLRSALRDADVWIELNKSWLLYSSAYEEVLAGGHVRYLCLVGMNADMLVRLVGRVDIQALYALQRKLAEITAKCRRMRIVTPRGTDVVFENDPERPILVEGEVTGPGEYMLIGQVDWAPIEESIEGTIVFDGSVWPPQELGLLREPITLHVEKGVIKSVEGGWEARVFETWLKGFNDPRMLMIAHISYGCNPGAKLTGNILEDERVWGVVEWGIGSQSPTFRGRIGSAPSHTDGVCLRPTVWGDGVKIIEDGEYVHPELRKLASKLRLGTLGIEAS